MTTITLQDHWEHLLSLDTDSEYTIVSDNELANGSLSLLAFINDPTVVELGWVYGSNNPVLDGSPTYRQLLMAV